MPEYVKFPVVLLCVTAVSAALLSKIYEVSKPRIDLRRQQEEKEAEKIAFPGAERTVERKVSDPEHPTGEVSYKEVYREGTLVGYLVKGAETGYSSRIEVLVGVSRDVVVQGVTVLFQQETPGLGTRVEEVPSDRTWLDILRGKRPKNARSMLKDPRVYFPARFAGLHPEEIRLKVDGGKVDAITGATVSSRAVTEAVRKAVEGLCRALGKKKGS